MTVRIFPRDVRSPIFAKAAALTIPWTGIDWSAIVWRKSGGTPTK
jgi:hypothetical protein